MNRSDQQRLEIEVETGARPEPGPVLLDVLVVLVVEDSASDQRLIVEALLEAGVAARRVECVSTLREARESLIESPVDCVLLDLSLPDASGLEGVTMLSAAAPDTPVIVITGQPGGPLVYAAMAEGADEFVSKDALDPVVLGDAIVRATQRRRGAGRHRQALASAAGVFDSIAAPIAVIDGSGRILAVNGAWSQIARSADADLTRTGVGVNYLTVCDRAVGRGAEDAAEIAAGIRAVLSGAADTFSMDYPCPTPGDLRWYSLRVNPSGEVGGGAVLIHMDVTQLKLAEQGARGRDDGLGGILDSKAPIFALIGPDASVLHVSDVTRSLLGLRAGERIGADAFELIESGDRDLAFEAFTRVASVPGGREHIAVRALDGGGRWRDLDLSLVNLLDDPSVGAVAVSGSDVTDARLQQIARQLESRLLGRLPVAVVLVDDRGIVAYWNESATELFGYSSAEAVGRTVEDLEITAEDTAVRAETAAHLKAHGTWEGDALARNARGEPVPVHTLVERVDDDEIDFHGVVYASIDNAERQRLEAELEFQAYHDPLTSLPNRRLFVDRLEAALRRHHAADRRMAVTFIDLDDFKVLNDRIGHAVGDRALQVIAERLSGVLRDGDIVSRIGGDEFVVAFGDLPGADEAVTIAERLLETVRAPFEIDRHRLQLSATVGIAMSQPGSPADLLLRNADAAMYAAKEVGKNRVGLFDDALQERTRQRRELGERLIEAIAAGRIHADLQPQVCLHTGDLLGFEALARWDGADDRFGGNADFIGLAEESGVVDHVDQLVLAEACAALVELHRMRPEGTPTIAVNVSASLLGQAGFPDLVRELVETSGFPPHLLCLEVVESALADEAEAAATLEALKAIGVELAIDDFGTGYSSLSRLQQFRVDYLKIDRGFVAGMNRGRDDAAIVSAVIGLAHALGLRTVAEGVETEASRDRLAELGVDIGQGYLWSRAMPVSEAFELVARSEPTGTPCGATAD